MHPIKSGAKFPFPWPEAQSFPSFFSGCFSAVLCRTLHSALQTCISFHKNLVLHIPANVPGYVAMAISVRLRWHSMTLGLRYMQPPPLASLIRCCNSYVSKNHFSTAAYRSTFHNFTMHRCISTKKKNKQLPGIVIPGAYRFYFSFWEEKKGEFRIRKNQEKTERDTFLLSLVVKPSSLFIRTFGLLFVKGVLYS